MGTDLPRRLLRPPLLLDLPRALPDKEGRIEPAKFDHYTRVLNEWARDVSDQNRDGIWIPELTAVTTDPTLGTGATISGDWHFESGWVTLRFLIIFGSAGTNAGSGIYEITNLPFRIDIVQGNSTPIGQAHLRNVGVASRWWQMSAANAVTLRFNGPTGEEVTHALPWAWSVGDNMRGWVRYKVELPQRGLQ